MQGNLPTPGSSRDELKTARLRLKTQENNVSELRIKQARVMLELEQINGREGELEQQLQALQVELEQLSVALDTPLKTPEERSRVDRQLLESNDLLAQTSRLITEAEEAEQHRQSLRDSLVRANALVHDAERVVQGAKHQLESAAQELQRFEEEGASLRAQQERALAALQAELANFGVPKPTVEDLPSLIEQLQQRREQWLAWQAEKRSAEQESALLEVELRFQKEETDKLQAELVQREQDCAGLRKERDELSETRREIFGEKCPDQAESELAGAVDNARQNLDLSQENLTQAKQAHNQLKSRVAELTHSVATRHDQLLGWETAFTDQLLEAGFQNEQAYTAACLPAEQRRLLEQQAQALDQDRIQLSAKLDDLQQALSKAVNQKITEQSQVELEAIKSELLAKQSGLRQSIAAAEHRLQENARLKTEHQAQAKALEDQQRESRRWQLLHELIGSSDGKKYRNFAQGLTFEIMIGQANGQLKKMTDRYLLIRDKSRPLELNVLDSYQGGEVRSTKNLSGGESFIVSLALALGLSQMTSHNVRVDSLFLDEGFGTLDEDALDTALETLASLQQEGKLIGVISHVPALKERIATQIQVQPQAGGRSVLIGDGCRSY